MTSPASTHVFARMCLRGWVSTLLFILISGLGFLHQGTPQVFGQDRPSTSESPDASPVRVGIGGFWKFGHATPLSFRRDAVDAGSTIDVEVEVVDGEGIPVIYRASEAGSATDPTSRFEILFRTASMDRTIVLRQTGWDGTRRQRSLSKAEQGTAIPPEQPWVVSIGKDLDLEIPNVRTVAGNLPAYTVSEIASADEVPLHAEAFEGVDLLAISTSDMKLIDELNSRQQSAITSFVNNGGHLLLFVGRNGMEVSQLPWLASLLPGKVTRVVESVDFVVLESLLKAKTRLPPSPASQIDLGDATSDLLITLPNRSLLSLLTRSNHGLGQVTMFAADLDQPPLQTWDDRSVLVQKLLAGHWPVVEEGRESGQQSSTTYLGYDDLIGQLRATLDWFPQVRWLPFSLVAFLLLAVLLVIGPGEFWLLVRVGKKPGWTWFSLLATIVAIAAALHWLYDSGRPKQPLVNQTELIDIDTKTGYQRGYAWFHVYSTPSQRLTVDFLAKPFSSGVTNRINGDWQPLPGKGIGSLQSGIRGLQGLPSYRVEPNASTRLEGVPSNLPALSPSAPPDAGSAPDYPAVNSVKSLPFNAGGTKSLRASWSDASPDLQFGNVREIPGSGLLEGKLKNPLSVDILDGILMYHNWVYILPTRIRSGEEITLSIQSIPQDLPRRLTRRRAVGGKDVTTPWNPADRDALPQLMEMLMFYRAAGGEKYTGLKHRFQPRLDLSDMLSINRAILVARLPESRSEIQLSDSDSEVEFSVNKRESFVRWILPVENQMQLQPTAVEPNPNANSE